MKKNILIFILGFIIGAVLIVAIVILYFAPKFASTMFILQETEIGRQQKMAHEAYLYEETDIAIWAISRHIDTVNRLIQERASTENKNPYLMLSPDVDLIFDHGRLGILYKKIGNNEKSKFHFEKALSYSEKTGEKRIKTKEDLISLITKLDKYRKSQK